MAGIPKLSSIPDPEAEPDAKPRPDPPADERSTSDASAPSVEPSRGAASDVLPATGHDRAGEQVATLVGAAEVTVVGEPTTEVPVVPEPRAEPVAAEARQAATAESSPPVRRRRRRGLGTLAVLVVLGAAAAGAYTAWPWLKERYVTPVQTNTDAIDATNARVDGIDGRLDDQSAADERIASTVDGVSDRIDDVSERIDGIDEAVDEQSGRIDDLDALAATLGDDLATNQRDAAAMVQMLRATELLGRARLFMYQANYGLAQDDMQAARDILAELPADRDLAVDEVIDRLDRSIATVTAFPVVAADDLDIAWQLLLFPQPQG